MSGELIIQKGFSNELLPSAAELYDAAFGAKLSRAMPNPISRISVLKAGFDPRYSFVALRDGELVGVAGFKTAQGSLTGGLLSGRFSMGMLRVKLGCVGAIRAALVLALFQREQSDGQLLMDGIGVAPQMRGSGVGTSLLGVLLEYAKKEGYRSVRLDVIDTNPAARRLYERVGFVSVKTRRFPYLKWLLGFAAVTEMKFRLSGEP